MVREARIQYRSMLEALFKLSALCLDADLLYPFLAQELIDARRVLDDFKKLRAKAGANENETPTESQILEYVTRIDSELSGLEIAAGRKLGELTPWKWAKEGGLEEIFWAEYARISQAVHHSLADFGWRSTDVVDFKTGARTLPGSLPPESVVLSATKALLLGIRTGCKAFSLDVPSELVTVDREVLSLYAKAMGV